MPRFWSKTSWRSSLWGSSSLLVWWLLVATTTTYILRVDAADGCPCQLTARPDKFQKAETARWIVRSLDWGVLSTISTRHDNAVVPFGNIYSFADGPCDHSTGVPYLYGTYLDQSFQDIMSNPQVSLSLSEASLASVCADREGLEACSLGTRYGDPESPICARLTLTGNLVVLDDKESDEYQLAQQALMERHSSMATWPKNHEWVIAKIEIDDVWLIDYFGGATILTPEEYFAVSVDGKEDVTSDE